MRRLNSNMKKVSGPMKIRAEMIVMVVVIMHMVVKLNPKI